MTVAFDDNTMVVECNFCPRQQTYTGSWSACRSTAKNDGWGVRKDDSGGSVDHCPECNKEAQEQPDTGKDPEHDAQTDKS